LQLIDELHRRQFEEQLSQEPLRRVKLCLQVKHSLDVQVSHFESHGMQVEPDEM
jgi:hypothetical protein